MHFNRRSLLRVSPALIVGIAGCSTRPPEGGAGGTSTSTESASSTPTPPNTTGTANEPVPMGTEQTVDGNTVTVHDPRAQTSVVHLTHPDAMGVTRADRGRYLFVRVRGTANGPAPTAFSLVVNGERFQGTVNLDDVSRMGTILAGEMVPIYDPGYGTERGWVAFVVPAEVEAEAARIELDEGAAWGVPGATLDRLRQPPPSWRLAEVSLPNEVSRGDSFTATVTVENTGEVAGIFRAVLNVANLEFAYMPFPFTLEIDGGGKDRWSRRFSVAADLDADEIGLYLRTPVGDEEQQVSVRE